MTFLERENKQPDESGDIEAALTETALEGSIVSKGQSIKALFQVYSFTYNPQNT